MCVSVIPHQETGGSASGNWLPAALARVAAAAGFAPGINKPHLEYKSNAASHLDCCSHTSVSQLSFLNFGRPCLDPPFPSSSSSPLPFQHSSAASHLDLSSFPSHRFLTFDNPPPSDLLGPSHLSPCAPVALPSLFPPLLNRTLTIARLLQPAWQVSNSSSNFPACCESSSSYFLPLFVARLCLVLTTATLVQLKTRSRQLPVDLQRCSAAHPVPRDSINNASASPMPACDEHPAPLARPNPPHLPILPGSLMRGLGVAGRATLP